jgi:CcmD family protein
MGDDSVRLKRKSVMYKKIYSLLFLLIGFLPAIVVRAQDSTAVKKVEMADRLRADGKIYVVIAVLLVILTGIFLYVVRLDRKISRMEKETK